MRIRRESTGSVRRGHRAEPLRGRHRAVDSSTMRSPGCSRNPRPGLSQPVAELERCGARATQVDRQAQALAGPDRPCPNGSRRNHSGGSHRTEIAPSLTESDTRLADQPVASGNRPLGPASTEAIPRPDRSRPRLVCTATPNARCSDTLHYEHALAEPRVSGVVNLASHCIVGLVTLSCTTRCAAQRDRLFTPADKLAGRAEAIWTARKQKLATANSRRRPRPRRRDLHSRRAPRHTEETWTEDRATRGRDPAQTRGQDRRGRHDAAPRPWDWPESDKSIHSLCSQLLA